MADKKVVTIDDRIPGIKEKRKKRTNRRLITYLSIFFILILVVVYFQSPLSDVRNIQVEGMVHVDADKLVNQSGIEKGVNIWNADLSGAERNVTEMDQIDSVSVDRSLPSTVLIKVNEYNRLAYIEMDSGYSPVLQNGTILRDDVEQELPADAPILRNFSNEDKLEMLTEELTQLGEGVLNRISEIVYAPTDEDEGELRLYMNDGITVSSLINNFASHMSSYPSVAREVDEDADGILHMKMSPYFESTEEEITGEKEENGEEE
ncbi:cell division protein FtsQ [Salibacterium salarium]|uniref:cell division protein FtsQ/DivIB n=1 Tax=Salibacterium salarium TaxID=284579 RepID=UPI00278A6E9A|nr:FtsQ-type POTRA domain-containing protein [Salibacterium salarium]MDQ0299044.1 cell division protein FtsQ [Salibacterium salarium]